MLAIGAVVANPIFRRAVLEIGKNIINAAVDKGVNYLDKKNDSSENELGSSKSGGPMTV